MKLKTLLLLSLFFCFTVNGFSQNIQDTINAARRASNAGQYKKALKYYKSAERFKSKEVDLSQEMGQTAYKAGDFETAERCFDDLAAKSRTSKERSTHLTDGGISTMKSENYSGAEEKFKEALRNDPSNEKARQLYMEAKRLKKQKEDQEKKDQNKKDEKSDENKDQNKPKDGNQNPKDGKNDKDGKNNKQDKSSREGDSQQKSKQSGDGSLEDKQTERKLDDLSKQEMDAKRRMNGTYGSQQGKKASKDW